MCVLMCVYVVVVVHVWVRMCIFACVRLCMDVLVCEQDSSTHIPFMFVSGLLCTYRQLRACMPGKWEHTPQRWPVLYSVLRVGVRGTQRSKEK